MDIVGHHVVKDPQFMGDHHPQRLQQRRIEQNTHHLRSIDSFQQPQNTEVSGCPDCMMQLSAPWLPSLYGATQCTLASLTVWCNSVHCFFTHCMVHFSALWLPWLYSATHWMWLPSVYGTTRCHVASLTLWCKSVPVAALTVDALTAKYNLLHCH